MEEDPDSGEEDTRNNGKQKNDPELLRSIFPRPNSVLPTLVKNMASASTGYRKNNSSGPISVSIKYISLKKPTVPLNQYRKKYRSLTTSELVRNP